MILEYGMTNYFSFKEGASISFRLPTSCPQALSQGRTTATALCIKGANGSGKTQILKALSFLGNFCQNSFDSKPEDLITVAPFFESTKPVELYIEFLAGDVEYRYEVDLSRKEVLRETIYKKVSKRTKIFERLKNDITYRSATLGRLDSVKLRGNASVISTAHQYDLTELSDLYRFFSSILSNVGYGGLSESPVSLNAVSLFLKKNEDTFGFVKNFIKECDTGISDINIVSKETESGETEYTPVFLHVSENKSHPITRVTESSGTKSLYRYLGLYKLILDTGGVLCLDEFDINLHPDILPKLIALFTDYNSNPHSAQIIFSTHNTEILDTLGRYRTYLVNKDDNESFAYRLDEIPGDILRNDRLISPVYREGKIRGVPRL